jgi:hypothetical protein
MRDIPARPAFLTFENRSFSAAEIDFLLARPSIRGLSFSNCTIGDEAVRALCALPRLERLWLAGSGVSDAVLPCIARVASLNWLVLDDTGITGAGLAALSGHPRLRHLSLRRTKVGDADVPHMVGMAGLSHLELNGSAVTPEGLLALAAHPTLKLCADESRSPALGQAFMREQRRLARRTPPGLLPGAGEEAAALAVLHGFWDGIGAWETELAADQAAGQLRDDWRQPARAAVFAQYCTSKHSTPKHSTPKHGTAGPGGGSFSVPPTYAQQRIVDLEWLSARKLCVYTLDHLDQQCRFVLMKKGSAWLLDHMQNLFDGWKTGTL